MLHLACDEPAHPLSTYAAGREVKQGTRSVVWYTALIHCFRRSAASELSELVMLYFDLLTWLAEEATWLPRVVASISPELRKLN